MGDRRLLLGTVLLVTLALPAGCTDGSTTVATDTVATDTVATDQSAALTVTVVVTSGVDEASARAAVEDAYARAFGDRASADLDAIDDPTGLDALSEGLRERYPEMLGGRVTYAIDDITFPTPTTATFRFRPVIADYAELPWQPGGAQFVGGSWRITRATACAMFSLGGAAC